VFANVVERTVRPYRTPSAGNTYADVGRSTYIYTDIGDTKYRQVQFSDGQYSLRLELVLDRRSAIRTLMKSNGCSAEKLIGAYSYVALTKDRRSTDGPYRHLVSR